MNPPWNPSSAKCFSSLLELPPSRAAPGMGEWMLLPATVYSSIRRSPLDHSNAVLTQSTEVNAMAWTSSGDGLIAGGVDVVLWKNEKSSSEIAWKYKERLPQTLVSAGWSLEGPSATAAHSVEPRFQEISTRDESKSVIVCKFIKDFGYMTTKLCHPHPVFVIQWRPLAGRRLKKKSKIRDVLLTCCMDGAVRLWTEIDFGRVKKIEKENGDLKPRPFKFCVVAVMEKSSCPSATLSQRLFVRWATEVGRSCQFSEEDCRHFPAEFSENYKNWEREWLVGVSQSRLGGYVLGHPLPR